MSCDSHWEENVSLADGNKWRPMIFTVLDVTETRLCEGEAIDFIPQPPGYWFEFVKTPLSVGGVGLFTNENYKYGVLERSTNSSYQALWIEILLPNNKKKIPEALFTDNIIMQINFLTIFRIPSNISVNKQNLPHTNKTQLRDYSSFNANKFMNDLSAINWEEVSGNCDVNKSFSHLYKTINHVVNKRAPLRDASVRKLQMLTKPWLTAGLMKIYKCEE